jgi:hypothetical protein
MMLHLHGSDYFQNIFFESDLWAGLITEEQASYLRVKYLGTEEREDGMRHLPGHNG